MLIFSVNTGRPTDFGKDLSDKSVSSTLERDLLIINTSACKFERNSITLDLMETVKMVFYKFKCIFL